MFDVGQKEAEIAELRNRFNNLEALREGLEKVKITLIEEEINGAPPAKLEKARNKL